MRPKTPYSLAPLPPPLNQVETIRTLKKLATASAALAELKGIAETMPSQQMLVNAIVLQEAKDSSGIENIFTSTDELYEALSSQEAAATSATKEVMSYRRSMMIGNELLRTQGFLRVNDIVSIQRDLISNRAGIRSTPGTVLRNGATGEVVYTPPQDRAEIDSLLANFINYYNDVELRGDTPVLIWLAILHHQFESIHPFYDGNGRTGRILNILFLQANKLLTTPILYLSSYIIRHKSTYYQLLNHVNKTNEWEEWILFMLDAVEETSRQTIRRIQSIRQLLDSLIETVRVKAPKIYSRELLDLIFEQPYCRIDYVVERLGLERKAASRYLRKLESIGVLKLKRIGRESIYINHELLSLLKN